MRRQIVFQVKKAFTDALVAREALDLTEQNLRALDDLERIQRYRAEKGDISELELLRIEVQRFALERDAADARQALRLAEVDGALSALRTERQKLDLLRDVYLPKVRRARDTVEFAYRRGGVSLLDYLDAQRTFRDTTTEFVRSLGSYWTAYYQLEAAVGGSLGEN